MISALALPYCISCTTPATVKVNSLPSIEKVIFSLSGYSPNSEMYSGR